MPAISVVLLTKNRRNLLEKCLISLSRQTYKDFEIIVLDEHSGDGTEKMVREMAERQTNINFIQRDAGTLGYARNMGVKAAKGGVIAFIDDDEEAHPDWLKRGLEAMISSGADIVRGAVYYPDGSLFRELRTDKMEFPTANIFYKKSVLEDINMFDERFAHAEDIDLGLRAIKKGFGLILCKDAITVHCSRPENHISVLKRSWKVERTKATNTVLLFKKHPEYRKKLAYGIFYSRRHITVSVLCLGSLASLFNYVTVNNLSCYFFILSALILSYLRFQVLTDRCFLKYPERMILFPFYIFLDVINTLSTVKGAIKYRFFML